MIYNGAPSFVASMKHDSASGNILNIKDGDENMVQVIATGMPATVGNWAGVGESKEVKP